MISLFSCICSVSSLYNNKLIILGDFNFPTVNWNILQGNTSFSNLFCDLIYLAQLVDKPTHKGGNILDVVLTNIEDSNVSLIVHSADSTPIKSDHFAIALSFNTQSSPSFKISPYYTFNYSRGDYVGLYDT